VLDHKSRVPQWHSDAKTSLILDANEAAARLWGYKREEFLGLPATALLCPEELPKQRRIQKANRWGETGPWKCRRKDGSVFYILLRWHQMTIDGRLCDFCFVVELGESLATMRRVLPEERRKTPRGEAGSQRAASAPDTKSSAPPK